MKALAASSIGQYEKAVQSLNEYYRTVELGLAACLRQARPVLASEKRAVPLKKELSAPWSSVPIKGSSADLTRLVEFATRTLKALPARSRKSGPSENASQALLADSPE